MNIVTMIHLRNFFTLVLVCSFFSLLAQEQQTAPKTDETLAKQFQELERKSGNYRADGITYEVVRATDLNQIKTSVFDSITMANTSIQELSATIVTHTAEIEALNGKLQETIHTLNTVTAEKDSIAFFGLIISKGTYNLILWAIIFTLLLLLLFFIYKFRSNNIATQQAKIALADLEKEYELHKRRALEREQKISRQLQDELNKQKKQ